MMGDPLIDDYGVIGNQISSALVSRVGSIDWACLPYLDSPSHFGNYLEKTRGGRFQICPQGEFSSRQQYVENSAILETVFETPTGIGILTDWMPHEKNSAHASLICRQITVIEGEIHWLATCIPRFRYGAEQAQAEIHPAGILFRGSHLDDLALLQSNQPLEISLNGSSSISRFGLKTDEKAEFVWSWGRCSLSKNQATEGTLDSWRSMAHQCPRSGCIFAGPWHEHVVRSKMIVQLFQAPYSGAIAEGVAVSTSDPTHGDQGWDDRHASIREIGWNIQALVNLGMRDEAKDHFTWLAGILERDGVEGLQPAYTLDGGKLFPMELDLPDVTPPPSSRRFQLDIYGHVVLASREYLRLFGELPQGLWNKLADIADYVCQAWRRPDHGPLGVAVRPEHFVTSKVFCWVALTEAIQIGNILKREHPPRWASEAVILHKTICNQGYDPQRNTFLRAFGSVDLDSSLLWLPIVGFLSPDDPRLRGTLDQIQAELASGVLLKTSNSGESGHIRDRVDLWSSFLAISCLALCGEINEASDRLAELCSYSNSLKLFGDSIQGNSNGSLPRCFPSLSVHLSLVNATLYIGWARGKFQLAAGLMGVPAIPRLKKSA